MSTGYHIYASPSVGTPVDYASIVATTSSLTWTSGALIVPGVWKFAVRAYDTISSLEESNVDALVKLQLDGSGADISLIPDPPLALSAHANGSGRIVVDWHHVVLSADRRPTGFHVYQGISGTVSYASPVATVAWSGSLNFYTASISGLTGGMEYIFGVRSYNATGEEANTLTASATAATTATATVTSLTGSAIA